MKPTSNLTASVSGAATRNAIALLAVVAGVAALIWLRAILTPLLMALFLMVLIGGHRAERIAPGEYRFSVAVHQPKTVPAALNGLGLWSALMLLLTVINYGFPIARSLATPGTAVPAVKVGERW